MTQTASAAWTPTTRGVVATICLAAFIGQVDASIVQLCLPTLEQVFDERISTVSWVATAYSLAYASALPVFARLAETGRRKEMYVAGFVLFGTCSALCGFAPSLPWLIACRGMQGIAGALLGANSVAILVAAAGPGGRGRAMGLYASAQAVGICAGPLFGGLLLQGLTWHWIFWVTVPVAACGTLWGWHVIPSADEDPSPVSIDWPSALLLMPALILVQLTITDLHEWTLLSGSALAGILGPVILLTVFARRELRVATPLLDVRIFQSPAFSSGIAGIFLSYATLYGLFFSMSFALVRGYDFTPLGAGLRLAVVPAALGIVAPVAGRFADDRPLPFLQGGLALCVTGLALLWHAMGPHGTETATILALALFGSGLGLFIAPNNSFTVAAAPPQHAGQAGGLMNLVRALGIATGTASVSGILSWRLQDDTRSVARTDSVPGNVLLGAVQDALLVLMAYAVLAIVVTTIGSSWRKSSKVPAEAPDRRPS